MTVSAVDHNILQTDNKNADDHLYLQTASALNDVRDEIMVKQS